MKKVKTKEGLKLYDGETHIKTMPGRYEPVVDRLTISSKGIRLSKKERLFLEGELIRDDLSNSPERSVQLAAEWIEGAHAVNCVRIRIHCGKFRSGKIRYRVKFELVFSNGEKITCKPPLFKYGTGVQETSLY